MGMSYELADAHVADMRAQVWTLTRATFTGAAILLREKAAYRGTSFRVKRRGDGGTTRWRWLGSWFVSADGNDEEKWNEFCECYGDDR